MSPSLSAFSPFPVDAVPLARLKPQPIPAIHPVAELAASGELLRTYEETKQTLQVPWMGVVTMAFAHYPRFYAALWRGLRPLCASRQFEDACRALRNHAETAVTALASPALEQELQANGYAPRELDQIRGLIEVFSHGNMPYLLLATLARLLLEGHPLSTRRLVDPCPKQEAKSPVPSLVLIEPHHADPSLRRIYDDIKATLGLPFVNTDYRALARWPSYFSLAWGGIKGQIHSPHYETVVTGIHAKAVELALALPNPALLDSERLQAAAEQDSTLAEVQDVVRLFQYLLPGLVANVACFRAQLLPEAAPPSTLPDA